VTLDVRADSTLLGAALEADLELAHACQMGMCGTCKSLLIAGEVQMEEPNTLSEEERERGFCLPCVSHPTSEVELDA
jgi:ferredoxin